MKLKFQLLMAGALTVLLPVVAYHAVQQMDSAWRDVRRFDLLHTANSNVALFTHSGLLSALEQQSVHRDSRDLYAETVSHSMALDGYSDDWAHMRLPARHFSYADNKLADAVTGGESIARFSIRSAISGGLLYLFIKVVDDSVVYHDPGVTRIATTYGALFESSNQKSIATGDRFSVFIEDKSGDIKESIYRAIAPGPIRAYRFGAREDGVKTVVRLPRMKGFWTVTNNGYQVELSMPVPASGNRFGITLVDVDKHGTRERGSSNDGWVGTVDPENTTEIGQIRFQSGTLERLLRNIVPEGSRSRLFDVDGTLLADVNRLYEKPMSPSILDPENSSFFNALLFRFFEWVITSRHRELADGFELDNPFQLNRKSQTDASGGDTSGEDNEVLVKSYISEDQDRVTGTLMEFGDERFRGMSLLFETNDETTNAFTSSTMVRLFSLLTLVSLLVAGSLFSYATWLSWRMRKLSKQARSAVGGDGRIRHLFEGSNARDEIGEMSRSFAVLVERSHGYTQYLESLASKLSHELRTPLSVVRTSLENIDQQGFDDTSRQLLSRAQGGTEQLTALIRSMSEATRLEQTVQRAEFIEFDAYLWLRNAQAAYRDVYPTHRFKLQFHSALKKDIVAVPELLQQSLDKLIGNAVDFAQSCAEIVIRAEENNGYIEFSVENLGATIDASKASQLFEPMYSNRADTASDAHLGLGLYVVRLISEAHGGQAHASNLTSEKGVRVGFSIKLIQRG